MNDVRRQNLYAVFTEGDELYDDMLWHIQHAQQSIKLECYIFGDDDIGNSFIDALAERAAFGVNVQVHLDTVGSFGFAFSDGPNRLRAAGVELKWFNPPAWLRLLRINRRNHRKLLVVDETTCWLGGFNIHNECSRRHFGEERWRDTQVRIKGPLAADAAAFFDQLWHGERRWRVQSDPQRSSYLVSNHNWWQRHRFRHILQRHCRSAKKYVWLTTPYFMPDLRTARLLERTAERGIDVRLLVPFKTDRPVTQWAARAAYASLLASGVRIYEYQPRLVHNKTAVIDGEWSTVGTANLDYRSFYVNFEMNLISRDTYLAAELKHNFMDDLVESREVLPDEWSRRGWVRRLGEMIGWAARRYL